MVEKYETWAAIPIPAGFICPSSATVLPPLVEPKNALLGQWPQGVEQDPQIPRCRRGETLQLHARRSAWKPRPVPALKHSRTNVTIQHSNYKTRLLKQGYIKERDVGRREETKGHTFWRWDGVKNDQEMSHSGTKSPERT